MTPIPTLTLAFVLALCAFCAQMAHAQIPVCKIYGTVDSVAGPTSTLTTPRASITVTRASKSGSLFLNTSRVFNADATGRIEFYAPRTVGTDTAVIHIRANFGDLAAGQLVYVPAADSAELRSLVRYTANPTFVVVAVPSGGGSGDTSLNGHPRLTNLENGVKAAQDTASAANKTANTADGKAVQAQATANVAYNVAMGARDSTSINGAKRRTFTLAGIGRLTVTQTNDSTFSWSLDTTDFMQGPRITNLESSVAAVSDSARKANDSARVIGPLATSTANDLTSHASTADAHLPSQTGASGKFLQTNGSVTSWQPEADPTASSRIDSALSQGARSIGTAGRYTVGLDSLTLTALGDTIDVALGNKWIVSLTHNDTLYFKGWPAFPVTADLEITVVQTGTYTLTLSGVRWIGAAAPTSWGAANKIVSVAVINRKGYIQAFPPVVEP